MKLWCRSIFFVLGILPVSIYTQPVCGERSILSDIMYSNPLLKPLQIEIQKEQYAIVNNPRQYDIAHVRNGTSALSDTEIKWRKRRFARVKQAQEKFLGMQLTDDEVLEIGFSGSGGGFRAMLSFLGSCCALQDSGLWDCCMSMAGLSGSTWGMAPLIATGLSARDYIEQLVCRISHGLMPDHRQETYAILNRLLVKFAYVQPLTTVDLYGSLLANCLLEMFQEHTLDVCLGSQIGENLVSHAQRIAKATYPFPVYTAVLGDNGFDNEWFEFTPYEVGCRAFKSYVPTWGFGRQFNNGVSTDFAPEQALGYLMGVFGSAFCFNLEEAYTILIKKRITVPFLQNFFTSLLETDIGGVRIAFSEVYNFMQGVSSSPMYNYKTIKLVDAGLAFNNPIFAVYRKEPHGGAPDIIIACDYGQYGLGFSELRKAATYAEAKKLKFPTISSSTNFDNVLTVVQNEGDLSIPMVLYMPRIKDEKLLSKYANDSVYREYVTLLKNIDWEHDVQHGYANTFNFCYTEQQARTVCALSEFNMLTQIEAIRNCMKERVILKRKSLR